MAVCDLEAFCWDWGSSRCLSYKMGKYKSQPIKASARVSEPVAADKHEAWHCYISFYNVEVITSTCVSKCGCWWLPYTQPRAFQELELWKDCMIPKRKENQGGWGCCIQPTGQAKRATQ